MIHYLGIPYKDEMEYLSGNFRSFHNWVKNLSEVEFDIETTVSPWWSERKLITLQFGWGGTQWVIQWSECTLVMRDYIKNLLQDMNRCYLIHNALFECTVMLFHGIRIVNVYDTMLAEQVLYGGDHSVGYGLDDVCLRRLSITLDKSQQKEFGNNIITPEKVIYAAQDVTHLTTIRTSIEKSAADKGYDTFNKVIALENRVVPAFAEMTFNGMELDFDKWNKNIEEAHPVVSNALEKLNTWLFQEPFKTKALELGYISPVDRLQVNWNSPKQVKVILEKAFPELPGTTKAILKKWQSDRLKAQEPVHAWIPYFLDGSTKELQEEVLRSHRDWLIDEGLLVPAWTPMINWRSTDQVLPLIQEVEPKLKALNSEAKGRCSHPIVLDLDDYLDSILLITTFGESFIRGDGDKKLPKIEPDGYARTSFNLVMTTGRVSSKSPRHNWAAYREVRKKYRMNSGKAEMRILSQDSNGVKDYCKVQRLRGETNNNPLIASEYLA